MPPPTLAGRLAAEQVTQPQATGNGAGAPQAEPTAPARPDGPLRLDIRTLKLRELRDIETAVGHKIAAEIATFDMGMDTVQGLLWIALRRQRPEATFDDAAELDFGDIISGISGPEEPPPEAPGGQPSEPGSEAANAGMPPLPTRPPSGGPEPS